MTQIDEWDVLSLKGMSGMSIMAFRYLTITPFAHNSGAER